MLHLISIAYATSSSSSVELWQNVASSTGQLIEDSFPAWEFMLGLLAVLLALTMVWRVSHRSIKRMMR